MLQFNKGLSAILIHREDSDTENKSLNSNIATTGSAMNVKVERSTFHVSFHHNILQLLWYL